MNGAQLCEMHNRVLACADLAANLELPVSSYSGGWKMKL